MKTAFIMGVSFLYGIIQLMEMMATGATSFSNYVTIQAGTLLSPTISQQTDILSSAVSMITNVAGIVFALIKIFFLWAPTVFAGNMLWVWWFVCFPITLGMIISIVWILRGVGSA